MFQDILFHMLTKIYSKLPLLDFFTPPSLLFQISGSNNLFYVQKPRCRLFSFSQNHSKLSLSKLSIGNHKETIQISISSAAPIIMTLVITSSLHSTYEHHIVSCLLGSLRSQQMKRTKIQTLLMEVISSFLPVSSPFRDCFS
jgi:hypothetical protein